MPAARPSSSGRSELAHRGLRGGADLEQPEDKLVERQPFAVRPHPVRTAEPARQGGAPAAHSR